MRSETNSLMIVPLMTICLLVKMHKQWSRSCDLDLWPLMAFYGWNLSLHCCYFDAATPPPGELNWLLQVPLNQRLCCGHQGLCWSNQGRGLEEESKAWAIPGMSPHTQYLDWGQTHSWPFGFVSSPVLYCLWNSILSWCCLCCLPGWFVNYREASACAERELTLPLNPLSLALIQSN